MDGPALDPDEYLAMYCNREREYMRIILQPYQTIPAASQIISLSERELRRGCEDGTIPHIWSGGICYVDIPALWDKLDESENIN